MLMLFFPFGVILFSLGAISVIPELEHIVKTKQKRIKNIIITGTIIPVAVYVSFILIVVGITGESTSKEALLGLNSAMENGILTLSLAFGVLAVATSYLIVGVNLKEIFWYDYHLSEKKSWAIACFIPAIIFILGMRDFITVVSIAGSLAGGLIGILIIIIFYKAKRTGDIKPAYEIKTPKTLAAFMIFAYIFGIICQFIYNA